MNSTAPDAEALSATDRGRSGSGIELLFGGSLSFYRGGLSIYRGGWEVGILYCRNADGLARGVRYITQIRFEGHFPRGKGSGPQSGFVNKRVCIKGGSRHHTHRGSGGAHQIDLI